jgi:hypothetical protein
MAGDSEPTLFDAGALERTEAPREGPAPDELAPPAGRGDDTDAAAHTAGTADAADTADADAAALEGGSLADASTAATALAERFAEHRKAVARLERALKGLGERWRDPRAVRKDVAALRADAGDMPVELAAELVALAEAGDGWLERERAGRRGRLHAALTMAAASRGLKVAVVTREPLELRLAPLGVTIDIEKARATVHFGKQELQDAALDAEDILAARDKALTALERDGWTPEGFHRVLRDAWRAAAARAGRGDGWVELADVLPLVAFAVQPDRFRLDPQARNYDDYGKARLLYELSKLREAGGLSQDGWRLVLGPATGGSTRDKRRVFWVEDGAGRGAYQLTLRFVRDEEIHGGKK